MSPAPPIPAGNVMQKIGSVLLALYIFLAYSRLAEQKFPSLHIPGIIFAALLLFLIAPGVLSPLLSSSVGRFFVAFNVLLFLSVPFSVWPGGSLAFVKTHWWKMFPLFPLILGLTVTFGEIVRLVRVTAAAILLLALFAVSSGVEVFGRMAIENSRFGDPNYIAMMLLFGIPLWAFFLSRPGASLATRALASATILAMLLVAAKTGSRGGLVAVAAVGIYAFFRMSLNGKIAFLVLAVIMLGIGASSLDQGLRSRYFTFFTSGEPQDLSLRAAAGSAEGRWYLLKRSIELTVRNPLLGVGVDMFQTAEHGEAVDQGQRRGAWHVTHNMYTQISSEIGIPAFICFIAVLAGSWRSLSRVEQAASKHSGARASDIARLAFCLKLSLLSLMLTGAFLSVAYDDLLAALPALIVALEQVARHEGLIPRLSGTPRVEMAPARRSGRLRPAAAGRA